MKANERCKVIWEEYKAGFYNSSLDAAMYLRDAIDDGCNNHEDMSWLLMALDTWFSK